jgi:hypothetical protein
MDTMEAKELYFVLMNETRQEKRDDAYRRLSGSNDAELKSLAESGKTVFEVIIGVTRPSALSSALESFNALPLADIWSGFAEATGQTLLLKALSMPKNDPGRDEIMGFGLRFISKAQDGGFPVSEATIGYVDAAGEAAPVHAKTAQAIVQRNDLLTPVRPFRERPSGLPPRTRGREGRRA